jgi:hypothetical protein
MRLLKNTMRLRVQRLQSEEMAGRLEENSKLTGFENKKQEVEKNRQRVSTTRLLKNITRQQESTM